MCISTDSKYQSPTVSLAMKSCALLPMPPCLERRVSETANEALVTKLGDLALLFPIATPATDAPSGLRLRRTPSKDGSEGRVQDALHRLSKRSSETENNTKEDKPSQKDIDTKLAERMSLLMRASEKGKNLSNPRLTGLKDAASRSSSPVPLRGITRSNSGAALCA